MAAKPFNWISWWEARQRMPEVWNLWAILPDRADRAMINALRRGRVPYRGADGWSYSWSYSPSRPVRLEQVVPALSKILLYGSSGEARLTYERAVVHHGPVGPYPPHVVEVNVEFPNPQLAWDEFRDDLIQFEVEVLAGATPVTAPVKPTSPQKKQATVKDWLAERYPAAVPPGKTAKILVREFEHDRSAGISERTVRRALGRK